MAVKNLILKVFAALLLLVIVDGHQRGAFAETYRSVQDRRPDLFHAETGFRIARQRAPTPDDIPPPARVADVDTVAILLEEGAVVIDVAGALQSRFDELDGTWLVQGPRDTLPGAVWLPEVGRGVIEPVLEGYLKSNLYRLTEGDPDRPVVVFCLADCWMSWNATQRVAALGYAKVYWFPEGVDGWRESGRQLVPATPIPVDTE